MWSAAPAALAALLGANERLAAAAAALRAEGRKPGRNVDAGDV